MPPRSSPTCPRYRCRLLHGLIRTCAGFSFDENGQRRRCLVLLLATLVETLSFSRFPDEIAVLNHLQEWATGGYDNRALALALARDAEDHAIWLVARIALAPVEEVLPLALTVADLLFHPSDPSAKKPPPRKITLGWRITALGSDGQRHPLGIGRSHDILPCLEKGSPGVLFPSRAIARETVAAMVVRLNPKAAAAADFRVVRVVRRLPRKGTP